MSRIVFDDYAELRRWAAEFLMKGRYVMYITRDNGVVLEPTKSTPPLRYGYIQLKDAKTLTAMEKLAEENGILVFRVKDYEWDATKAPGIKISTSE